MGARPPLGNFWQGLGRQVSAPQKRPPPSRTVPQDCLKILVAVVAFAAPGATNATTAAKVLSPSCGADLGGGGRFWGADTCKLLELRAPSLGQAGTPRTNKKYSRGAPRPSLGDLPKDVEKIWKSTPREAAGLPGSTFPLLFEEK